jgi:hypothetical protein
MEEFLPISVSNPNRLFITEGGKMAKLCFKIMNQNYKVISEKAGSDEVNLFFMAEYQDGDQILMESSEKNIHLWLQFDDALGKSLVYITDNITYLVPFGEKRFNMSPKAFYGNKHLLYARVARNYEITAYRNLALNVYDQNKMTNCYPHVSANVETRGEVAFAAKNVIDGVTANESHGKWPYQSWGINMQDDALIKIEFGRKVVVDRIILYTRADFPHDNWWKSGIFTFSDGNVLEVEMKKFNSPHIFIFQEKKIEWVEFSKLIKSEEKSPFPALTQMEVYGVEHYF